MHFMWTDSDGFIRVSQRRCVPHKEMEVTEKNRFREKRTDLQKGGSAKTGS